MDFELSEQQQEIKRVAHELLAERQPFSKVRAAAEAGRYDEQLAKELQELGWIGIAVPEEQGGQGLGVVELAVLAEELGYACAAVPFLGSAAVAAELAASQTTFPFLADLAAGKVAAAFGPPELLVDGGVAQVAVLLSGEEATLIEQPRLAPVQTVDQTRSYASYGGGNETPLGEGSGARVRIALAAEVLGLCQRALEMTVSYVKDRKQFDRPVGSFQAVAHRAAEMFRHTESLRSAVYYAAWAADAEPALVEEAANLAAAAAVEAGREVTAAAIQLHGGIGFTWEADLHWLYKRAQLDGAVLGPASRYHAALARQAANRLAAVG